MRKNKVNGKDGLIVKNSRRLAWKRIVFVLGCVVVFCTTYALILPAITMEVPTYCGFEEHIHTDECYKQITSESIITTIPAESSPILHHHTEACFDELGGLICGEADYVVHTHDENCYDDGGNLWCPLPEISMHIHDESCNIPQDVENEFHIHTDECYEISEKLICGFDTPETDISGSEIIGGIAGELTTSTDESIFPAPPADEFASGEVTTAAENDAAEPALPEISESVAEPISMPVAQPIISEPISEAVTTAQTDDSGFGEIIPGIGSPVDGTVTAAPVHQHTDECYVYEKTLICAKTESVGAPELGENALGLMAIGSESYGFMENHEEPTATIELDEPNLSNESICADLLETYDAFGNLIEPANQDETAEPSDSLNAAVCTLPEVILHEHDFNCYNESGELVCGMLAVRAHQHTQECNGICYIAEEIAIDETALTCEIPEGEGAHLHSLEYGCFDENMNIICPLEESFGHIHDIHCFGKWELICGMEEHDHTEECEVDPDDVTLDNEIMMLANAAGTWGYNPDGSIYWNRTYDLATVPLSDIKVNTPYIFCGVNGNTLMTHEDFDTIANENFGNPDINHVFRKAVKTASISDYSAYQYWCFEKAGDSKYKIYYQDTNLDKHYLRFENPDTYKPWPDNYTANLITTDSEADATVFDVSANGNFVHISSVIDGRPYYINAFWGDSNNTTHWWGHNSPCDIKICTPSLGVNEDTAQRLPTVTSSNTIINLFDYWIASDGPEGQFMPDNGSDYQNSGINNGHPFHFVWKGDDTISVGGKSVNRWVGENNHPLANIVAKTLGNDGYPHLSAETGSSDSLAYLFDPQIQHVGKASYRRVGGLLRNDEQGYYFFDSKQTMAEYNNDKNEIYIYNTPGIKERETDANTTGHFFPFNQAPEVMEAARDDKLLNHYFGMTITTRFLQKNGGYTSLNQQIPTSFHFSGDDDVWIFIDDVLVGDCGGIHDASSVDIDFSTGVVKVYNNARPDNGITTTIRDAFEAAGKTYDNPEKSWNGNTFADDTTHTLKFFYLERGNYSSNLELKYNLIDIPETSIYKVNQYGEVVPGAKFAVYAADANYNMLNNKDGTPVTEPANPKYNTDGDLVDDNNNVIAKALYTGITDSFGEMIFEDRNEHTPLTIGELRGMFGDRFILREIEVPDGYRVVSKDAWLRIWENGSQSILSCVNTSKTGSRAASTLQVTATDTIWVNESGKATQKTYFETETVNGHTITKPTGMMFAVVLKYTGPTYENGDPMPGELGKNTNWTPIYGDDKHGYTLTNVNSSIVDAAITAAKEMEARGNNIIFNVSPSCNMQLTLENLPGDITSYYRMLDEAHRNQTRYTVGFYWTDQPSLSTATSGNTFAVYSHKDDFIKAGITEATEFTRTFGANIQIPNLINRIFVQKIDENNNLINGATFAIYEVEETNGDIFFKNSVSINSEYNVDSTSGKITTDAGAVLAAPIATTTTATLSDNIHVGTGEFVNLNDGKYIIKEIKSPPGYALNKANIMVLVTEDTIYANAGTEDDGVVVGRGPGYVVNTLNHFASKDDIDSTLTWIYAKMKISNPSTSFNDVGDESKIKGYISKNMSSETVENADSDGVFKTYMMYTPSDASAGTHVAFNYYPNVDKYKALGVDTVTQYRRIFTTSGWPYYELWQDYEWGIENKTKGANYEQWPNELTNLFSRSTYIRVKDDEDSTLTVYKVNSDGNAPLSGAKFRLYRTNSAGTNEYYSRDESTDVVNWVAEESAATVITTGENGSPDKGFTHLKNGTYYLEEIGAPAGFIPLSHPVTVKINLNNTDKKIEAAVPNGDNTINRPLNDNDLKTEFDESSNVYTFTVTVRNTVGHELPQTGGCGTQVYTVAGISIIAFAIALTIIKKRKNA